MSSAIGVAQGGGTAAHGCVRARAEVASVSTQLTCFMREELRRLDALERSYRIADC